MTGNTKSNNQGQVAAWYSSVIAELPRIGIDIEPDDAQSLISKLPNDENTGRARLNALLWQALATRRTVTFPGIYHRDRNELLRKRIRLLGRFGIVNWSDYFQAFPCRKNRADASAGGFTIELMCFDQSFRDLLEQHGKAFRRGFSNAYYEDVLEFALKVNPWDLRMGDKGWDIVFPEEIKSTTVGTCFVLSPISDGTSPDEPLWSLRLDAVSQLWTAEHFYAYRKVAK